MSPRVLVVDDDWEIRWLVTFVLQRDPNVALVGEAPDGEVAVSLFRPERPDVVVIDVMMPPLHWLEATPRIKQEYPAPTVLVLTNPTGHATPSQASQHGARPL